MEGVGICFVKGIGKTIRNDSYGITTKGRVDTVAKQLKQKYGTETDKLDLLFPGSIWDDSDDWMMGVRRNERFYAYSWFSEKGFKPVSEVAEIALGARAISGHDGYVVLEFYFKRNPQCDTIIEKAGQDAF